MGEPESLLAELREHLVRRGAALVGVADLATVPEDAREGLPRGVAIGVALRPEVVASIGEGPTSDYAGEYERANALLNELAGAAARWLADRGFQTWHRPATAGTVDEDSLSTPLPHKTVARLAGLGWIGKCALLVTEDFGSAVRLAAVLTDAPLPTGTPLAASLCGRCTACVDVCPVGAPSGREWTPGTKREELFDAVKCLHQTSRWAVTLPEGHRHQICGMCIAACPFTRRHVGGRAEKHEKHVGRAHDDFGKGRS